MRSADLRSARAWFAAIALVAVAGVAHAGDKLAVQLAAGIAGLVDHDAAQPVELPVTVAPSRTNPGGTRLRFGRHTLIYTQQKGEAFVIGSRRHEVQPATQAFAPLDTQSITATAFRVGSRRYIALQGNAQGPDARAAPQVVVHVFAVHRTALSLDPPVSFANLHLGTRAIGRLPAGTLGVALIDASVEGGSTRYAATPMAIVTIKRALVAAGEEREIGRLRADGAFASSRS